VKIAILEDDPVQADLLSQCLSTKRYACQVFATGTALMQQLQIQTFDLLVLDWDVPEISGEEVLRWVRHNLAGHMPVIFLSGRSLDADIVSILDAGADDYLVKPVSPAIFLARVGSQLRRTHAIGRHSSREVFGEIQFDLMLEQVFVAGKQVALVKKEFELALLLFRHMDRPLSRTYIMEAVWKKIGADYCRTVDTHVSLVRRKLGLRPENGYRVTAITSFGYRLGRVADANMTR
jgi:DNA-binding response OmpR family regulator